MPLWTILGPAAAATVLACLVVAVTALTAPPVTAGDPGETAALLNLSHPQDLAREFHADPAAVAQVLATFDRQVGRLRTQRREAADRAAELLQRWELESGELIPYPGVIDTDRLLALFPVLSDLECSAVNPDALSLSLEAWHELCPAIRAYATAQRGLDRVEEEAGRALLQLVPAPWRTRLSQRLGH